MNMFGLQIPYQNYQTRPQMSLIEFKEQIWLNCFLIYQFNQD